MEIRTFDTVERKLLSSRLAWNNGKIRAKTLTIGPKAQATIKRVKEKIARGEYSFEECSCFCGSCDSDILISEVDRYGFYYPMIICKICGLMRTNPRMTEESYIHFYIHEYRDAYEEMDIDELFAYRMKLGKERYGYLVNSIDLPDNAVIFDIGCGFGTAILPFAEAGHDVYGCDYGIEHIEYGRMKMGLKNLFIGGPEKLLDVGKKADFVILHHVLEHFLDLEGILNQIHDLLKPNGICYVSIPGIYGRVKNTFIGANNILHLLQNAHTYQFNLTTLRYVMECCGFEFIKGNEEVESFFKRSNRYRKKIDCFENECWNILNYLNSVEKKFLIKQMIKNLLGSD